MVDKIKPPSNFGTTGPKQPRTPAPRRDAPGSVGAFDPVDAVKRAGDQRRVSAPAHGDFVNNSKDSVMSTHVDRHITGNAKAPDAAYGVRHASNEYPKRKGFGNASFNDGDKGAGVNYTPRIDAGHKS